MREKGYNACVTTGDIQSNHNRAIALMCAKMDGNVIYYIRVQKSDLKLRRVMHYS